MDDRVKTGGGGEWSREEHRRRQEVFCPRVCSVLLWLMAACRPLQPFRLKLNHILMLGDWGPKQSLDNRSPLPAMKR
jgi:hypothetical protein